MFITFLTVLAYLYAVVYGAHMTLLFVVFANLTPYEQRVAKITIPTGPLVSFFAAVAWVITTWVS